MYLSVDEMDEMMINNMNADQVSYYSAMVLPAVQVQVQVQQQNHDQHTAAEGDASRNRRHEAAAGSVARTLRVPIVAPPSPPPRVISSPSFNVHIYL